MKHVKLHAVQVKKEEYKKHLDRLSHIYNDGKEKKKILQESKSMDKLMAITHRLRQTSNKFKIMHKIQEEKLSTSRDWTKANCSFLPASKKPFKLSPSLNYEKFRNEKKTIEKENRQIFLRLLKARPTIQPSEIESKFNKTSRMPYLNKKNKTQMDFSSILNSSIIRHEQSKKINMRLHNHNEEVIKIRFHDDIKEILKEEKIYFLQFRKNSDKIIESTCFTAKELMDNEVCIFKKKTDIVEIIDVKQLFQDRKTIDKGSLYLEQGKNENKNESSLYFIFPNKKVSLIAANIEKKNLKHKGKHAILAPKKIIKQKYNENLPQISQEDQF